MIQANARASPEKLGRMLVIDGITMLTEYDEFAYHEMISHVPLLVHPRPSKVLIISAVISGLLPRTSRIRSKTTIVSFNE